MREASAPTPRSPKRTAHERICRFLLKMTRDAHASLGENEAIVRIPLKREEIADYLGMTPTHVNRVYASLREQGLISVRSNVYTILYREAGFEKTLRGSFRAIPSGRRGPVRVDPKHPYHFVWEGTGEHYFYNGTTAYWLLGVRDDAEIQAESRKWRMQACHARRF